MKDHYVSFECAQALKRLGFKEEVSHYYCHFKSDGEVKFWSTNPPDNHNARLSTNEVCSAPRLDQAAAWLREEKGWHIQVRINGVRSAYWYEIWSTTPNGPVYGTPIDDTYRGLYETYEIALSAGISNTLELLGKEVKQ